MMSRLRLKALLALGAAVLPGAVVAQVAGLPVRNAGIGTGIGVAVDAGFPNGAAGKGFAVGAMGSAGLGPFGVTASVAHWKPKGESSVNSVGATGNLKIFGGPLIPVSVTLQVGAARSSQDQSTQLEPLKVRTWHVPVGLGLALTIPNPVFSIKPWIAPRIDIVRTTVEADTPPESHTDKHFGISGGVDAGFLNGISVRVMYDKVSSVSILSLGLGFRVGL